MAAGRVVVKGVLDLVLVMGIHIWRLGWVGRAAVPLETLGGRPAAPRARGW